MPLSSRAIRGNRQAVPRSSLSCAMANHSDTHAALLSGFRIRICPRLPIARASQHPPERFHFTTRHSDSTGNAAAAGLSHTRTDSSSAFTEVSEVGCTPGCNGRRPTSKRILRRSRQPTSRSGSAEMAQSRVLPMLCSHPTGVCFSATIRVARSIGLRHERYGGRNAELDLRPISAARPPGVQSNQ